MRDPKTQAILDDAAALVRRSSVATGADIRRMDAIADRDRRDTAATPTFNTLDELLTD